MQASKEVISCSCATHVIESDVSASSQFTIGVLPFGVSLGAMGLAVIFISATFIVITVFLIRSRKILHTDLELLKAKMYEQPAAVYEELNYGLTVKPSSPTIDTGKNAAYFSISEIATKNTILS